MALTIGPYTLSSSVLLAPMAGITDYPFRRLCKRMGAGMVVAEMVSANPKLRGSNKTQRRLLDQTARPEQEPRSVQIVGTEPEQMAQAAQDNVARGAQIIDINMGCPAKKVCKKAAGSALMRDEALVARILDAVVNSVSVPVTLKIRTGWSPDERNAVKIATLAEHCGIQAVAVHGRTRACLYKGKAEYDTIAAVKASVSIPVIANGDIVSAQKAEEVLAYTSSDGVMVGRAAQGNPWLLREIADYLSTGTLRERPSSKEVYKTIVEHLTDIYHFYGEHMGVRMARKHMGWYVSAMKGGQTFREGFNFLETSSKQLAFVRIFFERSIKGEEMAA